MEEEDYVEPPPPSPKKVARRALVLSVVCCRGIIDTNPEAAGLATQTWAWLKDLGLEGDLSEWERKTLEAPYGSLALTNRVNAGWLSEAVTVLAWALGKADLPSFETQCDPQSVSNSLGFLQPKNETVLANPALLSPEQLSEYNEFIYNVHWRVRDFSIRKGPYNFESLARKAWGEPVLRHGLKIVENDISLRGVPISRVSESAYRNLSSITRERHRASNWLIGYASEDFYEVTTDT